MAQWHCRRRRSGTMPLGHEGILFTVLPNSIPAWPSGIVVGVAPGPADAAGARAQQNVIIGCLIDVFLESMNMVIAGNKLNVFPDGMHDVDQTTAPIEAVIETGRVNNNMRVGTDGVGL